LAKADQADLQSALADLASEGAVDAIVDHYADGQATPAEASVQAVDASDILMAAVTPAEAMFHAMPQAEAPEDMAALAAASA
jgi:hypothetical protein